MARHRADEREGIARDTRERFVRSAIIEFSSVGFDEANINHISMTAGFAKGTIYNYFPDKLSLYLEALDTAGNEHVTYILDRMRRKSDPSSRLASFFAAGFEYVGANAEASRFVLTALFGQDFAIRDRLGRIYTPLFRELREQVLSPGIERSIFLGVPTSDTANLLMTLYLGTASQTDRKGKPYLSPKKVADFALRAIAAGG